VKVTPIAAEIDIRRMRRSNSTRRGVFVTARRINASQIGALFGATGREINRLLMEQGFLFGEPSAYGLTPKGEEFGHSESHHRGSDGPSPIPRS
jgi:hypothetical protein